MQPNKTAVPRDYYSLLSRAVAALQSDSPDARSKIYDRARKALADQLGNVAGAQLSPEQYAIEAGVLADAIERVEADLATKSATGAGETGGDSAARAARKAPTPSAIGKVSLSEDRQPKRVGNEKVGPDDKAKLRHSSAVPARAADKLSDSIARLDAALKPEFPSQQSKVGKAKSAPVSLTTEASRPVAGGAPSSFSSPPTAPAGGESAASGDLAAQRSDQRNAALGKIFSILARTPEFRSFALGEAVALVTPAVAAGQALVIEARPGKGGPAAPVAVILWASVSAEVDARLSKDLGQPFRLAHDEWRCGDIPWLVLVAGESRLIQPGLMALQERIAKGRRLKIRTKDAKGNVVIGELPDDQGNARDGDVGGRQRPALGEAEGKIRD